METSDSAAPVPPAAPMKAIVVSRTPKQKIMFIRQIRAISRLGLKEAKDISEMTPPFVLVVVGAEIADDLANRMNVLLGEPGALETYDAEPSLVPVITEPRLALTELVNKSGCVTQAAAVLLAAGAALYFWL